MSAIPLGLVPCALADHKATLEQTFGSVRLWNGRLFVLDAISRDRDILAKSLRGHVPAADLPA